ncbi:helix-turn-helix domain-containing protein [Lactiplantibacillus mudanjiangensis]|uniref:Prophage P1 protein 14 [Lactobacillus plantarum WCFS1] n=1 Tax=Lactiplantibacillus mudanjiangensis TaxID=1296538 RepID=A0A660E0G3_9LACO|nr:hypothetical protein [Lactiplantibacillus mudanjiangensis]VDG27902.1 prophage P1 protein 14 [Lactobacillus plantarum WCFS1] [Lactiplantibacillus mudanjiangensis]
MDQKVTSAFMGAMLLDAMRHNQVSVQELAKKVGYTPSLISKATHDQARIQFDAVADLLAALPEQNQFFAIDVANKALGITTPVIDGDRILKEPVAMAIKTLPELKEALTAVTDSLDEFTIPAEDLRPEDYKDPEKMVGECYDAVLYLLNLIAYVCRGFNFSMQDELDKRKKIWIKKDIVKK